MKSNHNLCFKTFEVRINVSGFLPGNEEVPVYWIKIYEEILRLNLASCLGNLGKLSYLENCL